MTKLDKMFPNPRPLVAPPDMIFPGQPVSPYAEELRQMARDMTDDEVATTVGLLAVEISNRFDGRIELHVHVKPEVPVG